VATVTVRKLDEGVKARLRLRAARHGRSMEEEAREILRAAVAGETDAAALLERVRGLLDPVGGVDLELPPRTPPRRC
jgi:plasmid stability protein